MSLALLSAEIAVGCLPWGFFLTVSLQKQCLSGFVLVIAIRVDVVKSLAIVSLEFWVMESEPLLTSRLSNAFVLSGIAIVLCSIDFLISSMCESVSEREIWGQGIFS